MPQYGLTLALLKIVGAISIVDKRESEFFGDLFCESDQIKGTLVIDLNGKIINVLSNQYFDPGNHFVTFSNQKIPSGIYFININHKNGSEAQKITYLK